MKRKREKRKRWRKSDREKNYGRVSAHHIVNDVIRKDIKGQSSRKSVSTIKYATVEQL